MNFIFDKFKVSNKVMVSERTLETFLSNVGLSVRDEVDLNAELGMQKIAIVHLIILNEHYILQ